jgi:hypothetical protein
MYSYTKEGRISRDGVNEDKIHSSFFLFLIDLIAVQNNNSRNVLDKYSRLISEMNDSNIIRRKKEELVFFC